MLNLTGKVIQYESGEFSKRWVLDFYCDLLNTGLINELQGNYGRNAKVFIESGLIVTGLEGKWVVRDGEGSEG